jgi:hypothetical protein
MIRTQIQLPDDLYRDLKRLAEAKDWSLAETLGRGAQLLLAARHPNVAKRKLPWSPPKPRDLAWRGLTHDPIHTASLDDREPRLPRTSNGHARR